MDEDQVARQGGAVIETQLDALAGADDLGYRLAV
jgi:hypothetical protein